jgi:hypothetical protein
MEQGTIEKVVDALRERGFTYRGRGADSWIVLDGALEAEGASHPVEVRLDPELFDLPKVRLLQIPDCLKPVAPHVSPGGDLCYLARGSVVLDLFDPVGQTLACLERAQDVLAQILRGGFVEDLVEEFFAFWDGVLCFVDVENRQPGRQTTAAVMGRNGKPYGVITDNLDRTQQKLRALGWDAKKRDFLTFHIRTAARPRPSQKEWPPSTLQQLLAWQGSLDPRCRRKILQRVQEAWKLKKPGVFLLIDSPVLTYGVAVLFEDLDAQKTCRHRPSQLRWQETTVLPLAVVRLDDRYIAQRNNPGHATLQGKKIALVGCGTIGGFLAELLVKAGAGTDGGELVLVDDDVLLPSNLGRHRLGFTSLYTNKAKALASELERVAPAAAMKAMPLDVRHVHLGAVDLLIDATGEEALGHWLSHRYNAVAPMLTVWVEGPGTAVRALLQTGPGEACARCMSEHTRAGRLPSVDRQLPQVLAGQGCEGLYVPFPATVSVQAASLAMELTLDWADGRPEPLLRTRVTDRSYAQATADCNPPRVQDCPACAM